MCVLRSVAVLVVYPCRVQIMLLLRDCKVIHNRAGHLQGAFGAWAVFIVLTCVAGG